MTVAMAPPPAPHAPVALQPPAGMPVSGGFLQQQSLAADNRTEGGHPMPPAMPAQMQQPAGRPQWGQFFPQQPAAQPQQPYATQAYSPPAVPQPPSNQGHVMQPAPGPQPGQQFGQQPMVHDPLHAPAPPYQFNDGLALAGPSGGGGTAAQSTPAVASAALLPAGVGTPVQQPQVPDPGQPPSTAIRDNLVRQGLQVGHYQSDDQLLQDVGGTLANMQQLQQLAAYGRQYLATQQQGQPLPEQTAQVTAQSAQGSAQPAQPQRPAAPEWREDWSQLVRQDERTGRFVAVDPLAVNPIIVERANEYAAWRRQRADQLVRDPVSVLKPDLEAMLQQHREQIVQEIRQQDAQERQQQESQQAQEQFLAENRANFFQLDPLGQPVVNPINGQPVVTPRGHAAMQHAQQYGQVFAARYGHEPHITDVIQHVRQSLAADESRGLFGPPAQSPQQMPGYQPLPQVAQQQLVGVGGAPVQPAAQPGNQINRALAMNGAQYQPNQMGTIAAAAQQPQSPQNPNASFRDTLVLAAKQKGLLHPNYQ